MFIVPASVFDVIPGCEEQSSVLSDTSMSIVIEMGYILVFKKWIPFQSWYCVKASTKSSWNWKLFNVMFDFWKTSQNHSTRRRRHYLEISDIWFDDSIQRFTWSCDIVSIVDVIMFIWAALLSHILLPLWGSSKSSWKFFKSLFSFRQYPLNIMKAVCIFRSYIPVCFKGLDFLWISNALNSLLK